MNNITAVSFSRYAVFNQCRLRAKLAYINKIPEPDRGVPPRGLAEWPNDRGNRVHTELDNYVSTDSTKFPSEAKHFKHEILRLKKSFKKGTVDTEKTWCFNADWEPMDCDDYKKVRIRLISDVLIHTKPDSAVIIDYKTGRKFGNEVTHAQQLQLYQLGLFLRDPKIQSITAEIWYLDQNELTPMTFTREQGLRFFKMWDTAFKTVLSCTEFPPNANIFSCKWCPYRQDRSGDCSFGVY